MTESKDNIFWEVRKSNIFKAQRGRNWANKFSITPRLHGKLQKDEENLAENPNHGKKSTIIFGEEQFIPE